MIRIVPLLTDHLYFRLHHDNKNVIRNFLFLGFQPLAPGHEFHPSTPNVVCFLYTI